MIRDITAIANRVPLGTIGSERVTEHMAKKKTTGPAASPEAAATTPTPSPTAPRRRRAAAPTNEAAPVAAAAPVPSTADDRHEPMPEPAGQRVTPPDASGADSVTFLAASNGKPTYEQIAEAAYHRYLNRGAQSGRDFEDWVEAEQELRSRS